MGGKKEGKKQRKIVEERSEKLLSDIQSVEHAIEGLYRNFQKILDNTPDIESYESDSMIDQKLNSKAILFAKYIVRENKHNNLSVFNSLQSVIKGNQPSESGKIKPARNNATASSFDDFCKQQITNYIERQKTHVPIANSIPQNSVWPPPLPPIDDYMLRHKVYTHRSIGKRYTAETKEDEIEVNNERLEFLGDSIINSMFAIIAYEKLPYVDESDLTVFRRQLISNNTLSEWSKMYGMDTELRIDHSFVSTNKYVVGGANGSANTPKYIADVFEAYVGGLWEHYSEKNGYGEAFNVIKPWLEKLSEPFFNAIYSSVSKKPSTKLHYANKDSRPTSKNFMMGKLNDSLDYDSKSDDQNQSKAISSSGPEHSGVQANLHAKSELYTKIGKASMRPTYEIVRTEPDGDFVVACMIGKEVLATGTGRNTKIAGNNAALNALANDAVIAKFAAIRRQLNNKERPDLSEEGISGETKSNSDNSNAPTLSDSAKPYSLLADTTKHETLLNSNAPDLFNNPVQNNIQARDPSQKPGAPLVLTQQIIQQYTENPISSLKEFLEPISDKLRFEFKKNGDDHWICTFCIGDRKIVDGSGSSKKTAKKRASLCALLKHQDDLTNELGA